MLGPLAGCHGLERLDLLDCPRVTAAGLAQLHGLKGLKRLDLRACRLRSHETRALRQALPGCEVVRG
jgi:hypothetical protein